MIQASARGFSGTRIGNRGKCALDESGKYPVNGRDERKLPLVSIRDGYLRVIASVAKQSSFAAAK
jgi:hypothetical protein